MKTTTLLGLLLLQVMTSAAQTTTTPSTPPNSAAMQITSTATTPYFKDGKLNFNEDGSHYIKATFVAQIWGRYNDNNPGTTLYGYGKAQSFDIGLRRTRAQLFGQLTDKVFFYTQFGMNNFYNASDRQVGAFFHDVIGEYKISKKLSLGGGLGGWNGLSRFSSPSIGTIMCLDAPLFAQATNGATDQFLRKLSVYAKGKLGKLDYRIILSDPMAIQKAANGAGLQEPLQNNSTFSIRPPKGQLQGYFNYQFMEEEANLVPYTVGTYLGKKTVFNIGAGFVYQPNAMWHRQGNDTIQTAMQLLAIDLFYDAPLNKEKGTALSVYAGFFNYDFGPNYLRFNNAMNPAAGSGGGIKKGFATYGGPGNTFAMIGSGNIVYGQLGYLLAKDLLGDKGTLQPYASFMLAKFTALQDPGALIDLGLNWYINGHNAKLSLDYQSRPVFNTSSTSDPVNAGQKGALIVQYQVGF